MTMLAYSLEIVGAIISKGVNSLCSIGILNLNICVQNSLILHWGRKTAKPFFPHNHISNCQRTLELEKGYFFWLFLQYNIVLLFEKLWKKILVLDWAFILYRKGLAWVHAKLPTAVEAFCQYSVKKIYRKIC